MNPAWLSRSIVLALGLVLLSSSGCRRGGGATSGASFVPITADKFQPDTSALADKYKGKSVVLQDFSNKADNTQMSVYFNSPDQGRTYGNPNSGAFGIGGKPLESYFWYCFEKAFINAGLSVLKEGSGDANQPGVRIILSSIDENRFVLTVEVTKKAAVVLTKSVEVAEPPPGPGQDSEAALEQRAYRMMNKAAQAVLSDPEIQQAITS